MSATSQTSSATVLDTEFDRGLGLYDSTMIVIGAMIGSGIFIVSADMSRNIGSPGWMLGAWLLTGVLTVVGALSYGELAGFITAASYVRPSKSILDLEASSVKKRMKDKAFARGVKREDLVEGAALLGIPLEEHIANVIGFMREQADDLGLRGTL